MNIRTTSQKLFQAILSVMHISFRGIFRTQLNFSEGAFLKNYLMAKTHELFSQKKFIEFQLGPK